MFSLTRFARFGVERTWQTKNILRAINSKPHETWKKWENPDSVPGNFSMHKLGTDTYFCQLRPYKQWFLGTGKRISTLKQLVSELSHGKHITLADDSVIPPEGIYHSDSPIFNLLGEYLTFFETKKKL